jgi:tetratricopeptide (TPR) repeat protein
MSPHHLSPVIGIVGHGLLAALVVLCPTDFTAGADPFPPGQRTLQADDAKRVEELQKTIDQLRRAGKFVEAVEPAQKVVAICERALGPDHWQTSEARLSVDELKTIATLPEEGRKALATTGELDDQARAAMQRGSPAESEYAYRSLLEIHRRWLGEDHLASAQSYDNLAYNLAEQGKYAEAEPLFRKALAVRLKALGENHPHPALSYNNLAADLDDQARLAEAEPLYRKALAIQLTTVGENHPSTAVFYSNLGLNLQEQGRYSEAEALHRKALAIKLTTVGENHPSTALGYNNLGSTLAAQERYGEAEPLLRKALAIRLTKFGENHPHTAQSYDNLAANLDVQGRHGEAEPLFRKALAIRLTKLGENHPHTALGYIRFAFNLQAQARLAEAEPLYRKALAVRLKTLGEKHTLTALSYHNLAGNLDAQGKLDEAVRNWIAATAIYERSRRVQSATGLERALTASTSPLAALALALARQGKHRDAWAHWETDLARGLLDDLSARQLRPLTPEQRRREADLVGRLQRLDEQIARLAGKTKRTQADDQKLDELGNQQSILRGHWVEFQNQLDTQYRVYTGKPASLDEIQQALPADAALVGWLDLTPRGETYPSQRPSHWACVVRRQGEPAWVRIPGTGPNGAWTKDDDQRIEQLRIALASTQPTWRDRAAAVARQRLEPLGPHLRGATHLIVLPSRALAGIPVEVLVAAQDNPVSRLVVSYAPSGSMLARLSAPRSQAESPPRLLALGDPAFPEAQAQPAKPPAPPDYGLAIVAVVPNGPADLFGIRAGDVLLEYNGRSLKTAQDLAVVPVGDKAVRVPVKLWRDGEVRSLEIAVGPLGIQPERERPAAQVVLAQRAAIEVLKPVRGEALIRLRGTGHEVRAIADLFPQDRTVSLLGQDATESALQQLARSGSLKTYRYIHLATHGQANPDVAMSSALFLAAETERWRAASADPEVLLETDGQITAEQIVRTWELDADLVVLSACQSGLGRYAGGEGYLGFAQALFVKGARSLVLSLWKVDDTATALLMQRFYQNLLGRRAGLLGPLPKAEALAEAKQWLRGLRREEVTALAANLSASEARAKGATKRKTVDPAPSVPAGAADDHPYAHPYYWAAFVLVGDPD